MYCACVTIHVCLPFLVLQSVVNGKREDSAEMEELLGKLTALQVQKKNMLASRTEP